MPPTLPEEVAAHLADLGNAAARRELYKALSELPFASAWHVFDRLLDGRRPDWGQLDNVARHSPTGLVLCLAAEDRSLRVDFESHGLPDLDSGYAAFTRAIQLLDARVSPISTPEWLVRQCSRGVNNLYGDRLMGVAGRCAPDAGRHEAIAPLLSAWDLELRDIAARALPGEGRGLERLRGAADSEFATREPARLELARHDDLPSLDRAWRWLLDDAIRADGFVPSGDDEADLEELARRYRRRCLTDPWRRLLCWLLARRGGEHAAATLLTLARYPADVDVRADALRQLDRVDPDLAAGAAVRGLLGGAALRRVAEELLCARERIELLDALIPVAFSEDEEPAAAAARVLGGWRHPTAGVVILFGLLSLDDEVKEVARHLYEEEDDVPPALAALEELGLDLRRGAFDLGEEEPAEVAELLASEPFWPHTWALVECAADSENWSVRQNLVAVLRHRPAEDSLETLRSLCDDPDEDVRREALLGYGRLDDEGVPAMVLTALSDEDAGVRSAAEGMLEAPAPYPRLVQLATEMGPNSAELSKLLLDDVLRWGQRAGAAFLRQRVEIVGWRGGAGRTHFAKHGRDVAKIEINVEPLFSAGDAGVDVVKGVIVHELGHHKYDFHAPGFKSAQGRILARKCHPIFNIMLDERLERRLRSDRPLWGPLVDRMNAWLIQARPQNVSLRMLAEACELDEEETAARIADGRLPGRPGEPGADGQPRVMIGPWDAIAIPNLLPPLHAFFLGLMAVRDHDRIADPAAREALALIPADLKDMPHGPLATLTLQIARILGVDDGGRRARRRFARLSARFGPMMGGIQGLMGRAQRGRPTGTWTVGSSAREISSRLRGRAGPTLRPARPQRSAARRKKERGLPSSMLNLGTELEFSGLKFETTLEPDAVGAARIRAEIRPHVRHLRSHFERLGRNLTEHYASRRGRRLDMARVKDLALLGKPNALVHSEEVHAPDAYVGLLIDKSGSMRSGDRMPTARRFGVLLAEAARGLRGIEGHVNSFDGDTFYRLGDFQRHAISRLEADGGNNDAGGLLLAAQQALASRRKNRLIVMISDGLPAECSVAALRNLVSVLERRYGIACAQVAVAPISEVCFPSFLDVSALPTSDAVRQFGRLVARLTRTWR